MPTRMLTVDGLTFDVRESTRHRTIEIVVERDGSLVLATPRDTPAEALTRFVQENLVWVHARLLEKEAQAPPHTPREFVSGEGLYYLGRKYRLAIVDGVQGQPPLRLHQSRFELRRDAIPQARERFLHWYTLHLRPVLDRQIAALAPRIEARPREVHIQDLGYRWGSSNRRGHLYFHWRVAMLPRSAIEYLVAHELVHLVERNHGDAFWTRLARVLPDHADRQRWLKEHGAMYDL